MKSARLQIERFDFPDDGIDAYNSQQAGVESGVDARVALKEQVAARLAAHRSRRAQQDPSASQDLAAAPVTIPQTRAAKARANRIATAVAERYAHSQSYRDFLAAAAARAIEEANATAAIAARNARAVTAAQEQLLAELDLWNEPGLEIARPKFDAPEAVGPQTELPLHVSEDSPLHSLTPMAASSSAPSGTQSTNGSGTSSVASAQYAAPATALHPVPGLTVRLYEDSGFRPQQPISAGLNQAALHQTTQHQATLRQTSSQTAARATHLPVATPDEDEVFALDDEIAFRQEPVFGEPAGPPIPIPANLLEFPRQLVASRKARPRIAEGPLREEADGATAAAQLRIFEVEASQISTDPSPGTVPALPEWSSIHLDALPQADTSAAAPGEAAAKPEAAPQSALAYIAIQPAPLSSRFMAAAVDGYILGVAFLGAASGYAFFVRELPSLPVAALATAATLLGLLIVYRLLFFTFANATPGMRYARIGLCTFSDENPTRAQMRRRTWAILLATCPLGLGLLWALLDDEHLGWHDRISRMYQRSY